MKKTILLTGLLLLTPSELGHASRIKSRIGLAHITNYSHEESSRLTASGHILKDEDSGKVCAVGRDWWKKIIHPNDILIIGNEIVCVVKDTMAPRFTRRVDVYRSSRQEALTLGITQKDVIIIEQIEQQ